MVLVPGRAGPQKGDGPGDKVELAGEGEATSLLGLEVSVGGGTHRGFSAGKQLERVAQVLPPLLDIAGKARGGCDPPGDIRAFPAFLELGGEQHPDRDVVHEDVGLEGRRCSGPTCLKTLEFAERLGARSVGDEGGRLPPELVGPCCDSPHV